MVADQTTTERFIADASQYIRNVEEAAHAADAFGDSNSDAARAARQMGVVASEAANKAGRAMRDAADAAGKLAREEIGADEAAKAAAKAGQELARASAAQAAAARAASRAMNELADEERKAAEAAVVAAGVERLASLRAQGAVKEHNALLTHLRREYNGVGNDVRAMGNLAQRAFGLAQRAGTSAFDQISKGADKFASSGPVMIGAIIAALAAIPVIAIAAAGAVTLGLGAALAGIGIMAVKGSKEVKSAFSDLAKDAKKQAAAWSAPWKPALVAIASEARTVLMAFGPTMTSTFATIAPAVQRFAAQFGASLLELRPAIAAVGVSFAKLLDQLGPALPGIMADVSAGITTIAQTAGDHAQEITQLAMALGLVVRGAGDLISVAAKVAPVVNLFAGALDFAKVGAHHTATALDAATTSSMATGAAMGALGVKVKTAAQSATDLDNALNKLLNPSLAVYNDVTQLADGAVALAAALKKSHGELDGHTAASRVARSALSAQIATVASLGQDTQKLTGDNSKARLEVLRGLPALYAAAGANKSAKAQVDALAKSFGLNARSASGAKSEISALRAQIAALKSKTINVVYHLTHTGDAIAASKAMASGGIYEGYANGGQVKKGKGYAGAGLVSGPGTGTSDSVPAPWLSNGEYVIRASATAKNRNALDAANYHGAQLQAIPQHGLQTYGSGGGQVINNYFQIEGSVITENNLVNMLQSKILQQGKQLSLQAGR